MSILEAGEAIAIGTSASPDFFNISNSLTVGTASYQENDVTIANQPTTKNPPKRVVLKANK